MKYTKIPLRLIRLEEEGFHLLVEVLVFGRCSYAVLDTGASKTVLDKNIIQEHIAEEELLISDKLSTGLGTNSMESHMLKLPIMELGKLKITNFEVAVIDLSAISHAYSMLELPQVIGVIGGDILFKYDAIINYKKLELTLKF